MIFQQLAIPTTIELVCPFKCSKPLVLEKIVPKPNALFAQCPISEHIVTILNVIVLTGGLLHDC